MSAFVTSKRLYAHGANIQWSVSVRSTPKSQNNPLRILDRSTNSPCSRNVSQTITGSDTRLNRRRCCIGATRSCSDLKWYIEGTLWASAVSTTGATEHSPSFLGRVGNQRPFDYLIAHGAY